MCVCVCVYVVCACVCERTHVCACVEVCVHMGVPIQEPVEAESISSPEAGVTGD